MEGAGLEKLMYFLIIVMVLFGFSFFIFLYHCIRARKEARKKQLKITDTKSFGYILGGILLFMIEANIFYSWEGGFFQCFILVFSPVLLMLFGFCYNKLFWKK
ncbi:hypothetical protein IW15_17910 [Chryseobacterium soli]|uniref:Uncharacterized protein n=1 Tax=Chryseobacterium soli TaxID=445961 RepID=A0A086A2X4_9FLAO|nr:hypothetical protein IW15_17910 [Chryseobacterium soli]